MQIHHRGTSRYTERVGSKGLRLLENEERMMPEGQKRWQAGHRLQEEMPQNLEQAAMGSDSGYHTELREGASQAEKEVLLRKQRGSR